MIRNGIPAINSEDHPEEHPEENAKEEEKNEIQIDKKDK